MSERARIVAVYSAGGGTGKTLVASNLALSLHQQQSGRVLLVDGGHPMPGDLPIVLGVERVKARMVRDERVTLIDVHARATEGPTHNYTLTSAYIGFVLPLLIELQHRERHDRVANPTNR